MMAFLLNNGSRIDQQWPPPAAVVGGGILDGFFDEHSTNTSPPMDVVVNSTASTPSPTLSSLDYFMVGVCIVVALATCFGNLLVMLAVILDRQLHKSVGNYFLASLAVADFIVGAFVLPVHIVYKLYGTWPYSQLFCDIFTVGDVTVCTAR